MTADSASDIKNVRLLAFYTGRLLFRQNHKTGFPVKADTTRIGESPFAQVFLKCCSDSIKCMLNRQPFPTEYSDKKTNSPRKSFKIISILLLSMWGKTNFNQFRVELNVIFKNFNYRLLDRS